MIGSTSTKLGHAQFQEGEKNFGHSDARAILLQNPEIEMKKSTPWNLSRQLLSIFIVF